MSSSKVVTATYDAEQNVLRLVEPLEGVQDEARVTVTIEAETDERPWMKFAGCLSPEAGEELERAVEELFPTEK